MKHIMPVPKGCVVTQTFAEHERAAARMGCCSRPGKGCRCYYYGAVDLAPGPGMSGVIVTASCPGKFYQEDQGSSGYGKHGRIFTDDNELVIFGHLHSFIHPNGTKIEAGDPIGIMGSTGNSSGVHLHWEIREGGINGIPVDPFSKLGVLSPVQPTPPIALPDVGGPVLTLDSPYNRLIVAADWLNVRAGPGTSFPISGKLTAGEVITPEKFLVNDGWIRFNQGYCAWVYQGEIYLGKEV